MSNRELIHLLEKLTTLHDLADKKAYIALFILGGLALASPNYIVSIMKQVDTFHFFWNCLASLLVCAFLVITLAGLYFVMNTIVPRTTSSSNSIVFWGFAATKELPELQEEWLQQTKSEITNRLITEYHSNAKIAHTKFKHSKYAIILASSNIIFFFLIAILSLQF